MMNRAIAALIVALTAGSAFAAGDKKVDFAKDIKPIFQKSCIKCHSLDPDKPKKKAAAEFRLDDEKAALKGGRAGVDIVPGDAKNSRLYQLLSGPVPRPDDPDKEIAPMPHVKRGEKFKPLPADQVALIKRWIDEGAGWAD